MREQSTKLCRIRNSVFLLSDEKLEIPAEIVFIDKKQWIYAAKHI